MRGKRNHPLKTQDRQASGLAHINDPRPEVFPNHATFSEWKQKLLEYSDKHDYDTYQEAFANRRQLLANKLHHDEVDLSNELRRALVRAPQRILHKDPALAIFIAPNDLNSFVKLKTLTPFVIETILLHGQVRTGHEGLWDDKLEPLIYPVFVDMFNKETKGKTIQTTGTRRVSNLEALCQEMPEEVYTKLVQEPSLTRDGIDFLLKVGKMRKSRNALSLLNNPKTTDEMAANFLDRLCLQETFLEDGINILPALENRLKNYPSAIHQVPRDGRTLGTSLANATTRQLCPRNQTRLTSKPLPIMQEKSRNYMIHLAKTYSDASMTISSLAAIARDYFINEDSSYQDFIYDLVQTKAWDDPVKEFYHVMKAEVGIVKAKIWKRRVVKSFEQ